MLQRTYNWVMNLSAQPNAIWALAAISFIESSFFPIPPDILLIPMILAKRLKAWFYAFICTLSSIAGGLVGYAIGYFFYSSIGSTIIEIYGLSNSFNLFESYYNQYGIWIVIGAGFTPFPFKFITIASGVFNFNIALFVIAAMIARGLRFYLIATLLFIFGNTIKNLIDKYFNLLVRLFFILLIGSIFIIKIL